MSGRALRKGVWTYIDEAQSDRLAIDVIIAAVAGEDLDTAIERLEWAIENAPETKKRIKANALWNDLVERSREMMETAISDLKQLREREAATA